MLNWLFPPRCLVCREWVDEPHALCAACEGRWPRLDPPVFKGPSIRVSASGRYAGILLELVVRLKYRKEERLARFLGDRMAETLRMHPSKFDLILPIPMHVKRLRERGFNQALLLSRRVGRSFGLNVDPLLLRKKEESPPQAELNREERLKNLKGTFAVEDVQRVEGRKILLVDDVYTTGATVDTAARALYKAGAESVEALVLARTVFV